MIPQTTRSIRRISCHHHAVLGRHMPKHPSIASFAKWARPAPPPAPTACAIALHGTPHSHPPGLALEIATYLNEYDADGDGRWQPAPDVSDPAHHPGAPPPAESLKSLTSLAERGRVVLDSPLASAAAIGLPNVFHVGLGLPPDGMADCHIILNPALFPPDRLPIIIGDVFLEWATARLPRPVDFPTRKKIS